MTMIEPKLDMEEFLKDYAKGMSAFNLQDKYVLTPRQYRKIVRNIPKNRGKYKRNRSRTSEYNPRSFFNEPYIAFRRGKYLIRKNRIYYGQYLSFEIAKQVKKQLIEVDWDKSQLNTIRENLGIKPLQKYTYEGAKQQ